jgi:hypothetical protein
MTRVVGWEVVEGDDDNSDLFLTFDPSVTGVFPNVVHCNNLVTLLYKRIYTLAYGIGHYSSDDSSDAESIISSNDLFALVQTAASRILNTWFESGLSKNTQEVYRMPKLEFTKEEIEEILIIISEKRGHIEYTALGEYE